MLTDAGVDYVLIGGLAAIARGSPSLTFDIDVCVRFDDQTIRQILDAVRPVDARHRMRPDLLPLVDDPERLKGIKNLYLKTSLGVIDFLGEVSGVGGFDEVKARSMSEDLGDGVKCAVLDLDSLIAAKRAAGRPKDLRMLAELEAIRRRLRGEQP